MDNVERIGAAMDAHVRALLEIASSHTPRGGQRFPQEVIDVLSAEVPVRWWLLWPHVATLQQHDPGLSCLDFGCGAMLHRDMIRESGYEYVGLDYEGSTDPARMARLGTSLEGEAVQYDGVTIPFADGQFSTVWSWSSLEHCNDVERSLSEISRVLKPGGLFVGSVPHLGPYHALSTVNFTPYGFFLLCRRNGLEPLKILPSADGVTFMIKSLATTLGLVDKPFELDQRLRDSPFIEPLLDMVRARGWREPRVLALHAGYCAEFGFIARKRGPLPDPTA